MCKELSKVIWYDYIILQMLPTSFQHNAWETFATRVKLQIFYSGPLMPPIYIERVRPVSHLF